MRASYGAPMAPDRTLRDPTGALVARWARPVGRYRHGCLRVRPWWCLRTDCRHSQGHRMGVAPAAKPADDKALLSLAVMTASSTPPWVQVPSPASKARAAHRGPNPFRPGREAPACAHGTDGEDFLAFPAGFSASRGLCRASSSGIVLLVLSRAGLLVVPVGDGSLVRHDAGSATTGPLVVLVGGVPTATASAWGASLCCWLCRWAVLCLARSPHTRPSPRLVDHEACPAIARRNLCRYRCVSRVAAASLPPSAGTKATRVGHAHPHAGGVRCACG